MVTATKLPDAYEELRDLARRRPLTADDVQALPDDGNRYEIIGGQLIVSPSPNMWHQHVSFELAGALRAYLKSTDAGQGYSAPADVYLSPNDLVQPDILVVLREHRDIVQKRGIMGAPDLVIEILSPLSIETDFLRKSKLYERFGVKEYWIVNPEGKTVSVQTLEGDRFLLTGEYSRDDTLRSTVLEGVELELAAIFTRSAEEADAAKESQATNDE